MELLFYKLSAGVPVVAVINTEQSHVWVVGKAFERNMAVLLRSTSSDDRCLNDAQRSALRQLLLAAGLTHRVDVTELSVLLLSPLHDSSSTSAHVNSVVR